MFSSNKSDQKLLLKNPQTLKLWEIISQEINGVTGIDTFKKIIEKVLELLKRKIDDIDGITINDFNKLNSEIIEHMEESGKIYITSRKISNHSPKLIDFCISNGLLQKSNNEIYSYTHQTFIDHFIASNVI